MNEEKIKEILDGVLRHGLNANYYALNGELFHFNIFL